MRILHTMLRVADLERSIRFYCQGLGMQVASRRSFEAEGFESAFLQYGEDRSASQLELQMGATPPPKDAAKTFGHLAIGVPDAEEVFELASAEGGALLRRPSKSGSTSIVFGFLADPDGYVVEVVELRDPQ